MSDRHVYDGFQIDVYSQGVNPYPPDRIPDDKEICPRCHKTIDLHTLDTGYAVTEKEHLDRGVKTTVLYLCPPREVMQDPAAQGFKLDEGNGGVTPYPPDRLVNGQEVCPLCQKKIAQHAVSGRMADVDDYVEKGIGTIDFYECPE